MYSISYDRLATALDNDSLTKEEEAFLKEVCDRSPLSSISLGWKDHIKLFVENHMIEEAIFMRLAWRGNSVVITNPTWNQLTLFASSEADAIINGVPTEIKMAHHLFDGKFHFNQNTRWHGAAIAVIYNIEDKGIYWGFLKDAKDYYLEVKKLDEIR